MRRTISSSQPIGTAECLASVRSERHAVGNRHRLRDPHAACDEGQDFFRRRDEVRRAAELAGVARRPRLSRRVAGAERRGRAHGGEVRLGDALQNRRAARCSRARTTSTPISRRAIRSASTSCRSSHGGSSTSCSTDGGTENRAASRAPISRRTRASRCTKTSPACPASTSIAPARRSSRSCRSPTCAPPPKPALTCARSMRSSATSRSPTATCRRGRSVATPTSRCGRSARRSSARVRSSRT